MKSPFSNQTDENSAESEKNRKNSYTGQPVYPQEPYYYQNHAHIAPYYPNNHYHIADNFNYNQIYDYSDWKHNDQNRSCKFIDSTSEILRSYNQKIHRKRNRIKISSEQLKELEASFRINAHPTTAVKEDLALKLDIPIKNVQIWFQNRRAKKRTSEEHLINEKGAGGGRANIPTLANNGEMTQEEYLQYLERYHRQYGHEYNTGRFMENRDNFRK